MAERRARSAADREAARLSREQRRTGRPENGSTGLEDALEAARREHPPGALEPLPVELDHDAGGEPADEPEQASGTRRVSALARMQSQPKGRAVVKRRRAARPAVSRTRRWRGRIAPLTALVLTAAVIWFLLELFQPFHGGAHGRIEVTVPRTAGAGQIGDLLARDGVVSSGLLFNLRATLDGDRRELRAGTYVLARGMSYSDALAVLTTPPKAVPVTELTLIPGHSRAQDAALLRRQQISGNYLDATRHSKLLNPRSYGAPRTTPSLEGFLFPSTYQLRLPISLDALAAKQLAAFRQQFARVNLSYARRHRLTAYDVLIIASMVEAESATARDRPLVAAVIYNRLAQGKPLQIDATTRFATGNYTKPLTDSQLQSRSPYNTRSQLGLPPTPIDSPAIASIQAAAHPAQTNDLYFVVKPCGNGEMTFTGSYPQFLHDQQAYQQARASRGGNSPETCAKR